MLRIVLALLLLPGVAFGQSADGGGAMTRAEIETALQHSLRDSLTTTSIDLETVADTITMTAAGGSATLTGDVTDVTFWFTGIAGQTEPNACAIESGGDTLCLRSSSAQGYITEDNQFLELLPGGGHGWYLSDQIFVAKGGANKIRMRTASSGVTEPQYHSSDDLDSGLFTTLTTVILAVGGVAKLDAQPTYVETNGCRDYGTLTAAPTPNGACDEYYDDSGAKCFYNGATWDKIGAGTCV